MDVTATGFKPARRGRAWPVWIALLLAAGVIAAGLVAQKRERTRGETESATLRERNERAARLLAENRELEGKRISADERARLQEDREALPRLREEVEALRKSLGPALNRGTRDGSGAGAVRPKPPTILQAIVPESAWRNAGSATPEAAVETALWAAAGGDVELLASSLILDTEARSKAVELLARLPADVRSRYATPELLVALLAAQDVPLGGARILSPGKTSDGNGRAERSVQLRDEAGSVRQAHLALRETAGGWRLVVPEAAVIRYGEKLAGRRVPQNTPQR